MISSHLPSVGVPARVPTVKRRDNKRSLLVNIPDGAISLVRETLSFLIEFVDLLSILDSRFQWLAIAVSLNVPRCMRQPGSQQCLKVSLLCAFLTNRIQTGPWSINCAMIMPLSLEPAYERGSHC